MAECDTCRVASGANFMRPVAPAQHTTTFASRRACGRSLRESKTSQCGSRTSGHVDKSRWQASPSVITHRAYLRSCLRNSRLNRDATCGRMDRLTRPSSGTHESSRRPAASAAWPSISSPTVTRNAAVARAPADSARGSPNGSSWRAMTGRRGSRSGAGIESSRARVLSLTASPRVHARL